MPAYGIKIATVGPIAMFITIELVHVATIQTDRKILRVGGSSFGVERVMHRSSVFTPNTVRLLLVETEYI